MKVIIAGAGDIGLALARYLRAENNEIVLIDKDAEALKGLSEQLDIQTIEGNAAYPTVLEQAGAGHADVFLAVTGNDEANIVSCSIANSSFRVSQRIARLSAPEYMLSKYKSYLKSLCIDVVISPEIETATHLIDNLRISSSVDCRDMGEGLVKFIGLYACKGTAWIGKNLRDIKHMLGQVPFQLVAIRRRGELLKIESTSIRVGDEVYFLTATDYLPSVLLGLGYKTLPTKEIVVFGGGKVGYQLVKQLENMDGVKDMTLVEKREERARFLAEKLNMTLVIQGDALDDKLTEELNLSNYKIAIATTNSDENNILLSMISKRVGIERVCALIHNPLYHNLLSGLGIDTTVDPNAVMVSSILQYLRKGRVKDDYFIQSGIGEVLEMEALKTAKITKTNIGRLKVPEGVVIGGILREGAFLMPERTLTIRENDRVFLFVKRGCVQAAEKLFSVGISFF